MLSVLKRISCVAVFTAFSAVAVMRTAVFSAALSTAGALAAHGLLQRPGGEGTGQVIRLSAETGV